MEELEAVYYVTSSFEGNEEEVASHYIIEQTIDSNGNSINEGQEIYIETLDSNHEQTSISDESKSKGSEYESDLKAEGETEQVRVEGEHEQVIVMKEDGRVVIVKKEGNEDNMILGAYVEGDIIEDNEKDQNASNDYSMSDFPVSEIDDQYRVEGEPYDINSSALKEQPSTSESVATIVHLDKTSKKKVTAKVVKGVEPNIPKEKEPDDGPVVDKLTCKYCFKKFSKPSNKQRHIRVVHKMKKATGNDIKCVECDINFKHVNKLREHLQGQHGLDMSDQNLTFPNMSGK